MHRRAHTRPLQSLSDGASLPATVHHCFNPPTSSIETEIPVTELLSFLKAPNPRLASASPPSSTNR